MTTPETHTESVPRHRKMMAATALAASLAMSGLVTGEADAASATSDMSASVTDMSYTADGVHCAPITGATLHATRKLLNHPHDYDAPIKHVPHKQTAEGKQIAKQQEAAQKFNLTVYNYARKYRDLFRDARHANEKSVVTYLQRTSGFASHYDVSVTAPTVIPDAHTGEPIAPLDMGSLSPAEQKNARYTMTRVIDNLGEMPVEMVKNIGLKHIYFVKLGSIPVAGIADAVEGHTIFVDPRKDVGPNIISHEMLHLWDAKQCGSAGAAFQDPTFDALNPTNVYEQYPYTPTRQSTPGDYTDRQTVIKSEPAMVLARKIRRDYAHNCYARAEKHWRKYNALFKHVVAIREYGLKNISEDKATIGEEIFDSYDYQSIYNKSEPILATKFAVLLARIYQSHPRFAKYLIRVGNNKF